MIDEQALSVALARIRERKELNQHALMNAEYDNLLTYKYACGAIAGFKECEQIIARLLQEKKDYDEHKYESPTTGHTGSLRRRS